MNFESGHQDNERANHSATPSEEFIRAFTQSQRPLFLYLLPLLGNSVDADEVLQETNLIIWAKWSQFELGTNFLAWGRAIARLEVFRFRRTRDKKLSFLTDDVLEAVAQKVEQRHDETALRQEALADCVSKLRPDDRKLIQLRYAPGANGDRVAQQLGRPSNSVYQSLSRIRQVLMKCIQMKMSTAAALLDGGQSG